MEAMPYGVGCTREKMDHVEAMSYRVGCTIDKRDHDEVDSGIRHLEIISVNVDRNTFCLFKLQICLCMFIGPYVCLRRRRRRRRRRITLLTPQRKYIQIYPVVQSLVLQFSEKKKKIRSIIVHVT